VILPITWGHVSERTEATPEERLASR
jgi:hypothetical protein